MALSCWGLLSWWCGSDCYRGCFPLCLCGCVDVNALSFALALAVGILDWSGVEEGNGGRLRVTTYSPTMLLDSGLCSWVALAPSLGLVRKSTDVCLL